MGLIGFRPVTEIRLISWRFVVIDELNRCSVATYFFKYTHKYEGRVENLFSAALLVVKRK